tara:strand:- start:1547 stop:3496 length:1950 start_codon:yes stop_codon:yes gene_type:complete
MSHVKEFIKHLGLKPRYRRFLLVLIDCLVLPLSVWLSFWLRLADPFSPQLDRSQWLMYSSVLFGVPLYFFTAQYKGLTRFVGSSSLYRLAARNGLLIVILFIFGAFFQLDMPPRTSWFLLWLLLTGFTGTIRIGLRDIMRNGLRQFFLGFQVSKGITPTRVAIYGAGSTGAELSNSLRSRGGYNILTFIDDAPDLWSRTINGIPIKPPQTLNQIIRDIDQVLVAIPSINRKKRRAIIENLESPGISVLEIPSVDDITSGRARIDKLRPIAIEDLLGRDSVPPDPTLLGPGIFNSIVCVTGAGGSIGSELCRQIIKLQPQKLILFDHSEPNLYKINYELKANNDNEISILPILGNTLDESLVQKVFKENKVEVLFHAAAYKHVPLVEENPLEGIKNNVVSTNVICKMADANNLKQVIFISTDKAVRPTSVMGASKRLAELVVHAYSEKSINNELISGETKTLFSMVRFGNVLGSSGSVVPLFRKQIAKGGPVTLTHQKMTRYFMTIKEASQLVIQSGVLAKGGDVFLLDMGEPVSIKYLAQQMIKLSGFSVRDEENPDGDIEIISTGLRPGEKLYEELLIDAKSQPTIHPLIYRAIENSLPGDYLLPKIDQLISTLGEAKTNESLELLEELVPEWSNEQKRLKSSQIKSK